MSVFDASGKKLAAPIAGLGEVRSLAFGPDGLLYAADGKAGQVRIYRVSGTKAEPLRTFGRPARPGDSQADRFYGLRGAAIAPRQVEVREDLPRTRSGKIMRRLLKARELGLPEGDTSTLETPA